MATSLALDHAQQVFQALAARIDEIAFGYLVEGCESRAQLMIEMLHTMGLAPGRAWAFAVGRLLTVPSRTERRRHYKWYNHVAPTLPVAGMDLDVAVFDPSLTAAGPLALADWAAIMQARSIAISNVGLSQKEILDRQAALALQGSDLDAMLFNLRLGEPPIPELGGTGFRVGPDPPEGASAFARRLMRDYLQYQHRR